MITTPEQMREAAAQMIESTAYTSNSDGRSLEPVSAGLVGMDMHHATIAAAIRAIPIDPQPADLLSDPRVVALVEAVKAADTHIDKGHYEMARNITRAALRAIGGEA